MHKKLGRSTASNRTGQQVVDLFAVDPPIVIVSRLIESFNRVSNCRQMKGESLSSFVSRFLGLASENLLHREVLAITLLGNANLGDMTHQRTKIQLINAAKARHSNDANSNCSQPKCTLIRMECSDLRYVNEKLSDAIEALTEALNASGRGNTLAKARESMD